MVFSGDRPKNYNFIIEAADKDENIRVPAVANITDEMRNIMPLTPDWTYWPDYERVRGAGRGGDAEEGREGEEELRLPCMGTRGQVAAQAGAGSRHASSR